MKMALDARWGACNNYHIMARRTHSRPTMTSLLRQALQRCESFKAVERATGVKRQSLMRFARGEQSLRLDMADKLAEHFGLETKPTRKGR